MFGQDRVLEVCSQCYWVLDKTGKNYIYSVNAPHHVFDSTDASSYVIFFVRCGSYLCRSNFDSFSYIKKNWRVM